ncbi:unnamed protein product [Lasius platythorax]|uniref:Uncharacterized protein n=1 Tax=Lasius platythorax TaxID=488582 RepID=A0AAV2N987_9HYME
MRNLKIQREEELRLQYFKIQYTNNRLASNNPLSILEMPSRRSRNARNASVRQTLLIVLHCFGTSWALRGRYTENMHITIQMPYAERSSSDCNGGGGGGGGGGFKDHRYTTS